MAVDPGGAGLNAGHEPMPAELNFAEIELACNPSRDHCMPASDVARSITPQAIRGPAAPAGLVT